MGLGFRVWDFGFRVLPLPWSAPRAPPRTPPAPRARPVAPLVAPPAPLCNAAHRRRMVVYWFFDIVASISVFLHSVPLHTAAAWSNIGFLILSLPLPCFSIWEGVNHCSLHCRLAKFRDLMIRVKYDAVIGLTEPIAWKS